MCVCVSRRDVGEIAKVDGEDLHKISSLNTTHTTRTYTYTCKYTYLCHVVRGIGAGGIFLNRRGEGRGKEDEKVSGSWVCVFVDKSTIYRHLEILFNTHTHNTCFIFIPSGAKWGSS